MDDLERAVTIADQFSLDKELARAAISQPNATIEQARSRSERAVCAFETLCTVCTSGDGKIILHETIGQGGMGIVRGATQATLGRQVAVKTLRDANDLEAKLSILREAWITGALEHPNVVPIYDVSVDAEGAPIIIMKRIEGSPWSDLIGSADAIAQRFAASDPVEWNIRILASVCNAVHFAHSRGIVHRDLKPANVMVGSFGEVYVVDWGIAVSTRNDADGRFPLASQATTVAGTPSHMAPEMWFSDPTAISARTDVYLLGGIFYEIFAGTMPHEGDDIHALVTSSLLSNPRFGASFPAEAQRICQKAMSRDPADRYESAEAFRLAIEEYLRHRGSRKLARDAKQSLSRLLDVLEHGPSGEDRSLAVFNLLGECRFGYRAALSAWPDNEAARKGLDRALLAVIEFELGQGNAQVAATLLREVSEAPAHLLARVDSAARTQAEQEERLRRLEADYDPRVGSRTRTFIGAVFGLLWTVIPLAGWVHSSRQDHPHTHALAIGTSAALFALSAAAFVWARKTLTSTRLNRRLSRTLALSFSAQIVLGTGAWIAGFSPDHSLLLLLFAWGLTHTLVAVWVEPWFAVPASVCGLAFLATAAWPTLLHPLMALANFVFTVVLVRVWLPRQDLERIKQRIERRPHGRKWLGEAAQAEALYPDAD
jgi:serine/threonine-protein kinase